MTHIQPRKWKNSGSACCSPFGTCMLSWCCPCILYGRTRHRVKANGDMSGYSCCNMSCAAFCGLMCLGVPFVLPMISRGDMRAKYHLEGSGCKDCLCACCCSPCDLTQQDKEAKDREEEKQPLSMQPQAHAQMVYPPKQQPYQQQYQQTY